MKSLGVVSWKGGTGKTTLAFNLAERATNGGIDTTLCDFDPQTNALDYFRIRDSYNPGAMRIKGVKGDLSVAGIGTLRRQSGQERAGLLVCDLPGADAFILDQALAVMDLLVIPVTASPPEVTVTRRFATHVMDNNWTAVVVLNNLPPGTGRKSQLIRSMEQIGIEVAPASLVRRVSYWDASTVGLSVCEYAPRSPAAAEMDALWQWIAQRLNLPIQRGEGESNDITKQT